MDYSLLVGVDSTNNELVVGIVGTLLTSPLLRGSLSDFWQIMYEHTLGTRNLRVGSKIRHS